MAMYSSRPPFNDDPEPWVNDFGDRFPNKHPNVLYYGLVRAPRPEFDRPQNNPTNPALADFRKARTDRVSLARQAGAWLLSLDTMILLRVYTAEQGAHARRVLTRLARFAEES